MQDEEALANVIVDAVDRAVAPIMTRVVVLEQAIDRAIGEARAALAELHTNTRQLHERVAVVEVTLPMPGPPGPAGPAGVDGVNGKDGTPGLEYCGVYVAGRTYERGQLVTWGGSTWHCNESTPTTPGENRPHWTLMVKRGRDGKDGSR